MTDIRKGFLPPLMNVYGVLTYNSLLFITTAVITSDFAQYTDTTELVFILAWVDALLHAT